MTLKFTPITQILVLATPLLDAIPQGHIQNKDNLVDPIDGLIFVDEFYQRPNKY